MLVEDLETHIIEDKAVFGISNTVIARCGQQHAQRLVYRTLDLVLTGQTALHYFQRY